LLEGNAGLRGSKIVGDDLFEAVIHDRPSGFQFLRSRCRKRCAPSVRIRASCAVESGVQPHEVTSPLASASQLISRTIPQTHLQPARRPLTASTSQWPIFVPEAMMLIFVPRYFAAHLLNTSHTDSRSASFTAWQRRHAFGSISDLISFSTHSRNTFGSSASISQHFLPMFLTNHL
jgi:hypothetical protein